MRAKRTARVLVLALAFALLPALAITLVPAVTVVAHHEPTAADVVAEAAAQGMQCTPSSGQQDCTDVGSDFPTRYATITPDAGPLKKVITEAVTSPDGGYYVGQADRDWMVAMQSVGCFNATAVGTFIDGMVEAMGNPDGTFTTFGPEVVGECSMFGDLVDQGNFGTYWRVTSTLLPSAFSPTPSPTPRVTPSPTPRPTVAPTATPRPTVGPTARPTAKLPTATATATPTPSPSPTATATETARPTAKLTPEQTVAGIAFTPEPTAAPPADAGDTGGWARSVPVANDVSTDPATLAGSAVAALLLLLAMGFIGELFNNTFEGNYDRMAGWWKKSWLGRLGKAFNDMWGGGS